MGNRDALRRLTKKFPPPNEVRTILDSLKKEGDRSVAIVASALLESTLEKFLIAHIRHRDSKLIGQLFENRGPLSDFNGKILIGVAFGVFSPAQGDHFQIIRHVRNAFAHSRVPISFETPQINKEVQDFKALQAMKGVMAEWGDEGSIPENMRDLNLPTKSAFLLIVEIMMIMLDYQHRKLGYGSLVHYDDDPSKPQE
ncbi:MAG TPA: hypothetical protein VJR87_05425 [Allosphingosinicella sp.]|nr:hypothetical protein [Allosphingosinicella sp.]